MISEELKTTLIQRFFELAPGDVANSLEAMEFEEAVSLIQEVPRELAARVFDFLEPHLAGEMLTMIPLEYAGEILAMMRLSHVNKIILNLGEAEREQLLGVCDEQRNHNIRMMIAYPENTAGRLMSPNVIAFRADHKVSDAIRRLRNMSRKKVPVSYVYVTASDGRLIGVLNMRDLLLADENEQLHSIMEKNVFSVRGTVDREEVARQASQRPFQAIPVVDDDEQLLGSIKLDELLETSQEEATEDIQKMFGAGGDEKVFSPLGFTIKKRLPWLYVNLATAFLAAGVIGLFEDVIAKITILAVFLPVVAGQGGNAGAQSLAVVMRGLVLREVEPSEGVPVIFREGLLGLINGIVIGLVTALIAWLWHGNGYLGVVIGLAMVINMVIACAAGAGIPVVMKGIGWDPAQSSNIILTTVTDVLGFFVFLGLGFLAQQWLL